MGLIWRRISLFKDFPLFIGEISPKLSGFVRSILPTMRKKSQMYQIITEKHEIFTYFSTPYSRFIVDLYSSTMAGDRSNLPDYGNPDGTIMEMRIVSVYEIGNSRQS